MRIILGLVVVFTIFSSIFAASITTTQFSRPPDLSCILDPYTGTNNQVRYINETSLGGITLSKPDSQSRPTTALGINIPIPSPCANNTDLNKFFSASSTNPGYGSMIAHFNCKGQGPTCKTFKFDQPVTGMCLLVANVDGYDKLTIENSLNGIPNNQSAWELLSSGTFNPNGTSCPPMEERRTDTHIQLGCFEQQCDNPNYNIYRYPGSSDNFTFCYTSYSDSEVVYYSLTKCNDGIAPTQPPVPVYAISGYAFTDKNANGLFDIGIDTPIAGIRVKLINNATGYTPINVYNQNVEDVITNKGGYYLFQSLSSGRYQVEFGFPATATATIQPSPNKETTAKSNKIDDTFKTFRLSLASSTSQPVEPGEVDSTTWTKRIMRDINGGIVG